MIEDREVLSLIINVDDEVDRPTGDTRGTHCTVVLYDMGSLIEKLRNHPQLKPKPQPPKQPRPPRPPIQRRDPEREPILKTKPPATYEEYYQREEARKARNRELMEKRKNW